MTGNRLGISTGAFWPQAGTSATPALVAQVGVRDVEVMLQGLDEYEPAAVRALRDGYAAAGARTRSVHVKQNLHPVLSDDPREAADGWDRFARAIEVCAGLGATVLVWHGPNRREPDPERRLAAFPEAASRLGAMCAAAGIVLTIENVSYCALPTVRDVRRFADRLAQDDDRRVGFTFDPFQAAEAGANPMMMLAAMGGRLANVHLSDFRSGYGVAGVGVRHLPPGDGDLPWPALLRAIAHHYAGPLMLESPLGPDPVAPFQRVRAFLEPLIAAAGEHPAVTGTLPPGVREGIALHNAGHWYAAHEVIEAEWHAEPGSVRRLYQGILQVAVGAHHAHAGNRAGAAIKLRAALANLGGFGPETLGVDVAGLVAGTATYLAAVDGAPTAAEVIAAVPPSISYVEAVE